MSVWTNDGADIHVQTVMNFNCSVCGKFKTTGGGLNDWELRTIIRDHALEKHGGLLTSKAGVT